MPNLQLALCSPQGWARGCKARPAHPSFRSHSSGEGLRAGSTLERGSTHPGEGARSLGLFPGKPWGLLARVEAWVPGLPPLRLKGRRGGGEEKGRRIGERREAGRRKLGGEENRGGAAWASPGETFGSHSPNLSTQG